MGRWDRQLIDLLPKSMKVMASAGAGFDWIDTDILGERGMSCQAPRTSKAYADEVSHRNHLYQRRRSLHRISRRHGSLPHHFRLPPNDLVLTGRSFQLTHRLSKSPSKIHVHLAQPSEPHPRNSRARKHRAGHRQESPSWLGHAHTVQRRGAKASNSRRRSGRHILQVSGSNAASIRLRPPRLSARPPHPSRPHSFAPTPRLPRRQHRSRLPHRRGRPRRRLGKRPRQRRRSRRTRPRAEPQRAPERPPGRDADVPYGRRERGDDCGV